LPTCAIEATTTQHSTICKSACHATRLDPLLRAVFICHAVRPVVGVVRVNGGRVREVVFRPAKESTCGA
jgi:hypothetical protein